MTARIDLLQRAVPIVDGKGNPTQQFQAQWQSAIGSLQAQIDLIAQAQAAADAAQVAADTAQAAAVTADAAATNAQNAADTANATAAITNSYVTGATITATDAGTDVAVTISAHTRYYADGTNVSVSGGSILALAYSTLYYIYYDQPSRAGGSVTYQETTSSATAAQINDRHLVGNVMTPAAAAPPTGGKYVEPPGVGSIP